jgi:hypothetical protein
MKFLARLFSNRTTVNPNAPCPQAEFKGAGCFFTDQRYILAGYQPHKKTPILSGIGGRQDPSESSHVAAIRETLEELLNIDGSKQLIYSILNQMGNPSRVLCRNGYTLYMYSFQQLEVLLQAIPAETPSEYYTSLPKTVNELIWERKTTPDAEISHLCLLPYVKPLTIDSDFLEDLDQLSLPASFVCSS